MKLKFSIHYQTEWGQQLLVCLKYYAVDGSVRSYDVPMTTDDGDYWQAETSVVESRRSPLTSFTYFYTVTDADGKELRREWSMVPRTYSFDVSKNYRLDDQWRDYPLPYHLYSSAYAVTNGFPVSDRVEPLRLPLFRKTVLFRVSAPQLLAGQRIALLGSHPSIGAWSPARFLPMEYVGERDWMITLNADVLGKEIEYKYVIIDEQTHQLIQWEEGDNRVISNMPAEGEVLVEYREMLRVAERPWRVAGVSVPLFSLRSEHSYGVGDFGDLYRFVDWAAAAGIRIIQLLPVNDTTLTRHWGDSYPYNIVSAFALHPHYIDLTQVGELKDKKKMTVFRRRRNELNALNYCDYEAVDRVKDEYLTEFFLEQGKHVLQSEDYMLWLKSNEEWLLSYAQWLVQTTGAMSAEYVSFVQYLLHKQFQRAADYARSKGVSLKGDLPIGVNTKSAETAAHPELFNMDSYAGVPPDTTSSKGQNWGFPTYRWDDTAVVEWFHRRLKHLSQYFDVLRIDHVLGFFRMWEIPSNQVDSTLGHFSPSLPLSVGEIEYFGLSFRRDFMTRPFINDRMIERFFGIHAQYVRDTFLTRKSYGLYELNDTVSTQRAIYSHFEGHSDENSLWIRDGLLRLVANVLLIEDPRQPDMFHPRIGAYKEPVFEALTSEERDAFMRLYTNYFFQRHSVLWGDTGYRRLSAVFGNTRMLVCAEDLGMLPDCVEPVLDALRILTLEIQQMPKYSGQEFTHLDGNPVRSVATVSTHDMPPLRLWWQDHPEQAQRFFATMLQKQGRAPEQLPAHLAEEIIARHMYSPSMLCILSLQDLLSMDDGLRSKDLRQERINVPSDPYNHWQWRMHLTIEQLLEARKFNEKLKTMIVRSKRS